MTERNEAFRLLRAYALAEEAWDDAMNAPNCLATRHAALNSLGYDGARDMSHLRRWLDDLRRRALAAARETGGAS